MSNRIRWNKRLSVTWVHSEECGRTTIHWFWLFGHHRDSDWAICPDHLREMVAEWKRTMRGPSGPG